MKKKYFWLLLIVIVLVIILFFVFSKKENKDDSTKPEDSLAKAEEKVNDMTDKMIQGELTSENLQDFIGDKVMSYKIIIGEDSLLRERTTSKGGKLDDYEKAQDEYASRVEEYIKNNFEYKIDSTETSVEGNDIVTVTFKTYYYYAYLEDMGSIVWELLTYSGVDEYEDFAGNESNELKEKKYKAKVKAMEILDNYLDNYINSYEYLTENIITYHGNEESTYNSYESYLRALGGDKYEYKTNFPELSTSDKRVSKYINEAKAKGILDVKNPLKLK